MSILHFTSYSVNTRWFIAAMATVMMALSSSSYGYNSASPYLFITGLGVFFIVTVFMIIKAVLYYEELVRELLDPEKLQYSFSLVGIVSLTGICASRLFGWHTVANVFWFAAIVLWVFITLSSFTILFLYRKSEDRKIEDILNGGWFFVTIGTQFTALLSIEVAGQVIGNTLFIQFFSFALWSVGTFLYLIFMTFMICRFLFYPVTHDTELSSYWMNIGAAAITTIVSAALYRQVQMTGGALVDILPFLKGFSLLSWSIGLWWLPLLIILAIRKQINEGLAITFTVGYWEIVLAIGLFAAGTKQLTGLFDEYFISTFALYFSIAGAAIYCFASAFTLAHLIVIPVWKTIPLQALSIKWYWLSRGTINILQLASYSVNTRWFIVAIAAAMMSLSSSSYGYNTASPYLLITGLGVFFTVAVFMSIKAVIYYEDLLIELLDPAKMLYSHSLVGLVSLMGICVSRLFGWYTVANIFWFAAIVLWIGITLSSFTILFLYHKSESRKIEDILNGSWFFVTIGTQFTALLSIDVAGQVTGHALLIQFFSFALWSIGTFLYLIFITFMIWRLLFYQVTRDTELSSYWMNIGAAAVTTIVSAALYQQIQMTGGPLVELLPFLKGFSLFFWSVGLWWLPLLIILAIRKQISSSWLIPFTVGYWEIVLAICLFAAGTKQLTGLFDEHFIATFALYVSIAGAVVYCFISVFTFAHVIMIPVWKAIPVQALTVKWHWFHKDAVSILQFAICALNIRWFVASMTTITALLISAHYDCKEVPTSLESTTVRHFLRETIKAGNKHPQNNGRGVSVMPRALLGQPAKVRQ
ncbi:MAG: hypothetical protein K8F52_17875 [Candidatus Scalindua rubra]|uniref:Inorganic ion or dicarboxylate transport protein of TDT family protein n=1 Tax=Candidatus Scalindua brodae TaxID=237368 RepID=A0A0B0ELV6_9BACT|nr:MAG: inorganic ion or dicarboxylate transport protein of TDT family protein [Candidatus Scalindua brodae]MBZ0110525.1 hypothetical protein [Candidatus Scalindua rubra]TWU30764.1 putative membrane protein [Candidatus Brocadiaceae bacterium S225]